MPFLFPQASCILQLVKYIQKLQQKDVEVAEEVSALFAGELNPVAPKAQKKVPVPEGYVGSAHEINETKLQYHIFLQFVIFLLKMQCFCFSPLRRSSKSN